MTVLDGSDPEPHREWLDAVYSDDSLPAHYATVPGTDLMWPTSSSTEPSLMTRMLTLLDVHPAGEITRHHHRRRLPRTSRTSAGSAPRSPASIAAIPGLGVEAAGHYHQPMIAPGVWPGGWQVVELNPALVTAQRRVNSSREVKTDRVDLTALSKLSRSAVKQRAVFLADLATVEQHDGNLDDACKIASARTRLGR